MIHSLLSSLPNLADNSVNLEDMAAPDLSKIEETTPNENSLFFKEEERAALNAPVADVGSEPDIFEETEHHSAVNAPSEISEPNVEGDHSPSDSAADSNILSPTVDPLQFNLPVEPAISAEEDTPSPDAMISGVIHSGHSTDDPNIEKPFSRPISAHPELTLVELLTAADALYEKFPPSHSGLALSAIMGPQSVVFTWSESASALPSDHTAEAMVVHPELVVYPYVERHDEEESADEKSTKARRKRRRLHKSPFGQMEKKTMLAGTVIVLGVAIAVYEMKVRQSGGGHGLFYYADGHGHGAKDWKRVGGWFGGALAGLSQKLFNGAPSDV